jgi:hypothetical protein
VKKIDFEGAEKLFCKKLKKFSKTPLKNVKKYNIMVAIIGFVLKTTVLAKERTSNAR